ncbi:leucine-rich repeat-containing protein 41 [Lithobates pipiens]
MEEAPEDAGGSPSLFQLCARAVTANMERLEEEVWDLPAIILQGLLPLLNIYYLERIESAATKKGLSTQSIWCKLWNEIMKNKPTRLMTVTCWRKKFLETFFHNVLRGTLDVSSDWRLNDRRFSPLVHSSQHVSEFTIFGKQQGVSELTPAVLERLAQSVESLRFLHIRLSDPNTQKCLKLLLHHLIHHGHVTKVSVLSWPRPDKELLVLILNISAGYWQEVTDHPCALCAHPPQWSQEELGSQSALLSLQPLNISQNVAPDQPQTGAPGPSEEGVGSGTAMPLAELASKTSSTSNDRLAPPAEPASEAGDLYDFIFSVPPTGEEHTQEEETTIGEPLLPGAIRLRSVRTLNLHNVFLTPGTCRCLCQLLRSWVSLERLTMAYNDLQTNISMFLEALSHLARDPRCSLSAISMSDFSTYVTILDLAQTILRTFPALQSLLLCYDLEESSDKVVVEAGPAEFTENQLKQLDLRFPQNPLEVQRLASALKASPCLVELSLDNAILTRHQDVKLLLQTITEHNGALRRLGFHDLNLTDSQTEIVHLLSHSSLEEVKFSFCRLFERMPRDFLALFVGALKKNSTLKILKLGGNRLGNKGLVALADLYAADSLSLVHCLDVSSNCITSAGLLQFAKKLEGLGNIKLRRLLITQNGLDMDPITTHNALRTLERICCVVKDSWDPSHAFADHVSVM